MAPSRKNRFLLFGLATLGVIGVAIGAYLWLRPKLPGPGSPVYEEYAEAFEVGTAALNVSHDPLVLPNLNRAIELMPQEPAAWANRGLFYLRHSQLPETAAGLRTAH